MTNVSVVERHTDDKMATTSVSLEAERMKMMKLPMFKKKGHETQYRLSGNRASKFSAVKGIIEEAPPSITKAIAAIQEGEKLLAESSNG